MPVVGSISQYKAGDEERVRIYLEDAKLSYGIIGYNRVDINYDETSKKYYIDETKQFIDECMDEISEGLSSKRLFVGGVDYARGQVGAIVHMNNEKSFVAGYEIIQGANIETYMDYKVGANNKVSFVNTLTGATITVKGEMTIAKYKATGTVPVDPTPVNPDSSSSVVPDTSSSTPGSSSSEPEQPQPKKGCFGGFAAIGVVIGIPALVGASVLFLNKKRKEGGK